MTRGFDDKPLSYLRNKIWFDENDEIKRDVLIHYINPWMNIPVLNSASKNAKQLTKFMSNILLDDN